MKKKSEICIKWTVHIFNVWTIIMQSLNMKEWILLELQLHKLGTPYAFPMEKND